MSLWQFALHFAVYYVQFKTVTTYLFLNFYFLSFYFGSKNFFIWSHAPTGRLNASALCLRAAGCRRLVYWTYRLAFFFFLVRLNFMSQKKVICKTRFTNSWTREKNNVLARCETVRLYHSHHVLVRHRCFITYSALICVFGRLELYRILPGLLRCQTVCSVTELKTLVTLRFYYVHKLTVLNFRFVW